jgi:hypothetical protein
MTPAPCVYRTETRTLEGVQGNMHSITANSTTYLFSFIRGSYKPTMKYAASLLDTGE